MPRNIRVVPKTVTYFSEKSCSTEDGSSTDRVFAVNEGASTSHDVASAIQMSDVSYDHDDNNLNLADNG